MSSVGDRGGSARDAGRVVIVGAGLAGFSAAWQLRTLGAGGAIALIDQQPGSYDRPPLSKELFNDDFSLGKLAFATSESFAEKNIETIFGVSVASLEPGDETRPAAVTLNDGRVLQAESVLLATGGHPRRLQVPGLATMPVEGQVRIHYLREFSDALALREAVTAGTRLLIVGAGLIGAELASSLCERGAEVTLVDPVETPLVPAVGELMAGYLHSMHTAHGIQVHLGGVDDIEFASGSAALPGEGASAPGAQADASRKARLGAPGARADGSASGQTGEAVSGLQTSPSGAGTGASGAVTVTLSGGERVTADHVVIGVGILPAVELAEAAGLEVDNGIIVDASQHTSSGRVWAAGDASRRRGPGGVLERREEHWEAAQLSGQAAAYSMLGRDLPARGAAWFWSDRHGVHLEAVGRLSGPGELVVRPAAADRHPAVFLVEDGVLQGAASLNDANTVRAARRLIDQAIPVTVEALADPAVSLRSLLRVAK